MTILGNRNNLIDDDLFEKEPYTIPSVVKREDKEESSLKKSIIVSFILHPLAVGTVWFLVFVLALLGITFSIFEKPKPKVNDIEFTLVNNLPERQPLNKKTKFRSDRNTRTGGKRDTKRPVSMPSPSPSKKVVQQKSVAGPKQQKPVQKQKAVTKKVVKQHSPAPKNIFKSTEAPQKTVSKPKPPSARPSLKPASVPRPTMRPTSPFRVPIPKAGTPGRSYSTGPVGSKGTSSSGSNSSGRSSSRGSYAPVPSLAPTGGRGGASGSRLSRSSSGYGASGNPGGGGGAPGIDSIREPDFGPYMRELQRRIKMNWDPPKGNESKRVIVAFKIAKNGRLLSVNVKKSSGVASADKAAINAVELTAPFKPLPAGYRDSSVDIIFTFDYNVFGASGYR